ncbi:serpin family protein [Tenacibaculum sp. 190524A02b]|uniref:serpin family protein n=1 Tax=Tenacibaculum vairaonense TaxID=3137860 RepID=UPI0031FAF5E5
MQKYILSLFKLLYTQNNNVVISPYCLELLLNILAEGAVGETRKEILKLIEVEEGYIKELAEKNKKLVNQNQNTRIEQENTIYHIPELEVNTGYRKNIAEKFPLKIEVNKSKDLQVNFIIESVFSIKALWAERFYELPSSESFKLSTGEEIEALYVCQSNVYGENTTKYFKTSTYQAIQIPLQDKNLNVEIYLPNTYNGLQKMITSLNSEVLSGKQFKKIDAIEVYLPKFKVNFDFELQKYKKELGISNIFETSYDYKNLFKDNELIEIVKVTQKNDFELTEKGIEGKSITRAGGIAGGIPEPQKYIVFEASHSFLYVVRDITTESILFLGTVDEPIDNRITKVQYNQKELATFIQNEHSITDKTSLLLTIIAIEKIINLFKIENKFTTWLVNVLWRMIEKFGTGEYDRLIKVISDIDVYSGQMPTDKQELIEDLKSLRKEKSYEIFEVIRLLLSRYESSNVLSNVYFIEENLGMLNDLDIQLPSFNLIKQFEDESSNTESKEIIYRIDQFFENPIPVVIPTEKELLKRKQEKIIRQLKPKTLHVTIRGLTYFGLISLQKIFDKYQYNIPELNTWINEYQKIITDASTLESLKKKVDEFSMRMDEQTGFYNVSSFIEDTVYKKVILEYPEIEKILSVVSEIPTLINYIDSSWGLTSSIMHSCESVFKELLKHNIELTFFNDFLQYKIEENNIIGSPISIS